MRVRKELSSQDQLAQDTDLRPNKALISDRLVSSMLFGLESTEHPVVLMSATVLMLFPALHDPACGQR